MDCFHDNECKSLTTRISSLTSEHLRTGFLLSNSIRLKMQPNAFIRPHTASLNQVVALTEVIYYVMVILVEYRLGP